MLLVEAAYHLSVPHVRTFAIITLFGLAIYGCSQKTPTEPTPIPASMAPAAPQPAPNVQILRVRGRVIDGEGRAVAGARLTSWFDSKDSAMSDAQGMFDFGVSLKEQDRSFWVTVEKPGYETSELARTVEAASATSLPLHAIRNITAGESWRASISPDDSACGYHWGYVCRRLRVKVHMSGTLSMEVTSEDTGIGMPVGPVGFPQRLERRVSVPVMAGSELSVDVAAGWPVVSGIDFTLRTTLSSGN